MPLLKPMKTDPDEYEVEYTYGELEKLLTLARDIQTFGRMVEDRAENTARKPGFWDGELACVARIQKRLVQPFADFFSTAVMSAGDIAVDRKHDPRHGENPQAGKSVFFSP